MKDNINKKRILIAVIVAVFIIATIIVNVIKDLVSNVGFPILAFLLMFKQNKDLSATISENTKAINDLREKILEN